MPIRADDPRPPHEQIAAELRDAIEAGDLKPGTRLPSTRELMRTHGVANMTAQRAVGLLRDEGLVDAQPGRGVFVRQRQPPGARPSSISETLSEARRMLAAVNDQLSTSGAADEPRDLDLRELRATVDQANELLSRLANKEPPQTLDFLPSEAPSPEPGL